jgi:Mob1/phocein family
MVSGTWYISNPSECPLLTKRLAVDFFNHLNMLYGTVTEFCTAQEVCPMPDWELSIEFKLVPNHVFWPTVRLAPTIHLVIWEFDRTLQI